MVKYNCGIYQIKNIINKKIYIGQTTNLHQRKNGHLFLLRNNKHTNEHLQSSYNKYGEESFVFETLLYCESFELTRYEQFFVDRYSNTGLLYNICLECVDSKRGIKLSDKAKLKIKKTMSGVDNPNITDKNTVLKVRSMIENGFTIKEILKAMNISQSIAYKIRNGFYNDIYNLEEIPFENIKRGGVNCNHITSKKNVLKIKDFLSQGKMFRDISEETGVSRRVIEKVRDGWYDDIYNLSETEYRSGNYLPKIFVLEIIEMLNNGINIEKIHKETGRPRSTIRNIKNGSYDCIYNLPKVKKYIRKRYGKNSTRILSEKIVFKICEELSKSDPHPVRKIAEICSVSIPSVYKVKNGWYDDIYDISKYHRCNESSITKEL